MGVGLTAYGKMAGRQCACQLCESGMHEMQAGPAYTSMPTLSLLANWS